MKFSVEEDHGSGFDPLNDGHDKVVDSLIRVNDGEGGFDSKIKNWH